MFNVYVQSGKKHEFLIDRNYKIFIWVTDGYLEQRF